MRRIVLTGFRGTGKSAVGRILAEKTGAVFIDTDDLVERMSGRPIPAIFAEDGEERFRAIEREAIASLPAADAVVSTGGGAILDPANTERLRRGSVMIYLFADLETIEMRLKRSPRPPLTGLPLKEEIAALVDRRRQNYAAAADICIDTSDTTPESAADHAFKVIQTGSASEVQRNTALAFFRTGRIPAPAMQNLMSLLAGPNRDPTTRVLGVAGYPCAHSRGPTLFNALFEEYGLNYHYTWFEDPELAEIVRVARGIDAKGLSVTIPFKADVMQHLDHIDEHAMRIGAVNTVVFSCGEAAGYNTDWLGVRQPLAVMKGAKAVLLGAGGVAAAAAYAMMDLDMDLTILNRTAKKAEEMAAKFGCRSAEWSAFDRIEPDLVVNATPIGMEPDLKSPLEQELLKQDMTVFDLVYTPPETPFIQAAWMKGCTAITGTEMFIGKAKEQFYLFFGIDVEKEKIRETLS